MGEWNSLNYPCRRKAGYQLPTPSCVCLLWDVSTPKEGLRSPHFLVRCDRGGCVIVPRACLSSPQGGKKKAHRLGDQRAFSMPRYFGALKTSTGQRGTGRLGGG